MSPSKLDPHQKARDFRRHKRRHKRHNEKDRLPVHVDVTSVTYASQLVDDGSRFTVVDALPEMDEEWVNEIVYVRSPTTGTPDRAYMGIQMLDDSLAWIEITLAAPAPPNEGNDPAPTPDPSGITWIRHYGTGLLNTTAYFATSLGIAVDTAGSIASIWIADARNDKALRIHPSTGGVTKTVIATRPRGIAMHSATSTMYVAQSRENVGGSGNSRIQAATGAGGLTTIATFSTNELSGLAINIANTQLYMGDITNSRYRRVQISDGTVLENVTHAQLSIPRGIHVASDGSVYVADSGTHLVHLFPATGTTRTRAIGTLNTPSSANGQFNTPMDVWTDDNGRVYVADMLNNRVQIFSHVTGAYINKFGTSGTGDGQFTSPVGVSGLDGTDTTVYVHDGGNSTTQAQRVSTWTITDAVV